MFQRALSGSGGGGGNYEEVLLTVNESSVSYNASKGAFFWESVPSKGSGGFSLDENGEFHGQVGTIPWYINVTYSSGVLNIQLNQNQYNVKLYACYEE